ncbi:monosaccharide ABC transporter ATP-binding protein (CUT2 family) [Labedella gwakjiensis]|uniref:Monosaccharide ABC transporter ATP-binding protein (CUT2 family) n=1 Tax=Labedella gwakjiensis TaxID=390269 RepID=A0A2P8GW56_9MICO|nr:sugar ABC transporter ATP-binding protein [Labedella gwakjiensis]PSL38194.1 monosaccharide ABC transporter ATP-binding protein (CUT2 family) [Labedella gwakjiensis]RUQ87263.1 sugar ABC transporter ATP-binding protein [Labedella gwakjiensis]
MSETRTGIAFAARGITKSFGPVRALRGVELELRRGEVTALMGENGAGKSTLLKIITGDYQPDDGVLELDGSPVVFAGPGASRASGVRVIAQEPEIVPHVSVAENIFIGSLGRLGYKRSELLERAAAALDDWGFARVIRPELIGSTLSPAQRQIVEIMRALISEPEVICFDEPTSSLGDDEVAILFAVIRRLRDQGVAIGYVSHRMAEIFQLADRITVLRDGGLVGTEAAADIDDEGLVRMMVGRDLTQFFQREAVTPGEVVLELIGVSNEFVDDISLTVRAGEVVGIAGLVGAGRSELMKTIVGDFPLTAGELRVSGTARRFRSPADSVAAGIGFAPEERKAEALLLQRTVRDNMALAMLRKLSRWIFVRSHAERALAAEYITRMRVRTPSAEQIVGTLSGGNQQKVVLARWLATGPKLLLLDEPTRGVDVGAKSEIYTIIDELARSGVAVLVVSSELPEVIGISDRIYVMAHGHITGEVPSRGASEESILALAMEEEPTFS